MRTSISILQGTLMMQAHGGSTVADSGSSCRTRRCWADGCDAGARRAACAPATPQDGLSSAIIAQFVMLYMRMQLGKGAAPPAQGHARARPPSPPPHARATPCKRAPNQTKHRQRPSLQSQGSALPLAGIRLPSAGICPEGRSPQPRAGSCAAPGVPRPLGPSFSRARAAASAWPP
jgi:hypothetical protein